MATCQPPSLFRYYFDLVFHLESGSADRRKAVREVYIDIHRLMCFETAGLLAVVRPGIRKLVFVGPVIPHGIETIPPPPTIAEFFSVLHGEPFARLTELGLPLNKEWDKTVDKVLSLTPHLRKLTISSEQPFSGHWGDVIGFPPSSIGRTMWPVLPYLTELVVEEMCSSFAPFVLYLCQYANRLEKVILRDPGRMWMPLRDEPVLHHLRGSSTLRYLGCRRSI